MALNTSDENIPEEKIEEKYDTEEMKRNVWCVSEMLKWYMPWYLEILQV